MTDKQFEQMLLQEEKEKQKKQAKSRAEKAKEKKKRKKEEWERAKKNVNVLSSKKGYWQDEEEEERKKRNEEEEVEEEKEEEKEMDKEDDGNEVKAIRFWKKNGGMQYMYLNRGWDSLEYIIWGILNVFIIVPGEGVEEILNKYMSDLLEILRFNLHF